VVGDSLRSCVGRRAAEQQSSKNDPAAVSVPMRAGATLENPCSQRSTRAAFASYTAAPWFSPPDLARKYRRPRASMSCARDPHALEPACGTRRQWRLVIVSYAVPAQQPKYRSSKIILRASTPSTSPPAECVSQRGRQRTFLSRADVQRMPHLADERRSDAQGAARGHRW
jgi:hypothetical protein